MTFKKYEQRGGYHWKDYVRNTRYRKHADHIKQWVKETNVLDVGAGDGLITYLIGAKGIEYEPKAVEIAQAIGLDVIQGDAYALPFPDNSFDAVTMFDVLEHFEHPEQALKEAWRVAPVLYISTPERGTVNDPYHVHEWTASELPEFMRANGWEIDGVVLTQPKDMYARFKRIDPS